MFRDAGLILRARSLTPAHAVSYGWLGFTPRLQVHAAGKQVSLLDLNRMFLEAGEEKTCVGRFTSEGYMPCPGKMPTGRYAQCQACAKTFIPQLRCVFEPRCRGELCEGADFCKREHKVYLSFFGHLPKIGMTSTRRLMRRLIEQGADGYCIIGTVQNRKDAREMEKKIGATLGLRQAYRPEETLAQLVKNLKVEVGASYEETRTLLLSKENIRAGPLYFIEGYPSNGVGQIPERVETTGMHAGEVIGVKGKYLFYKNEGGLKALDLGDIIGRKIRVEQSAFLECENNH